MPETSRADVSNVAAGRGSANAARNRESDPQPSANGMHNADAGPSDTPASPPPSAFAAEEVQSPAAKAAAAKRALSAITTSAADAPARLRSPALAMPSAAGVSDSAASLHAPSLAARLDAGTGVLASSQVLFAGHAKSVSFLVESMMRALGHHITRGFQCSRSMSSIILDPVKINSRSIYLGTSTKCERACKAWCQALKPLSSCTSARATFGVWPSQDGDEEGLDAPAASTGVFASQGSEPEADELAAEDSAVAAAVLESGSDALRLGSSAGLPSESIDIGAFPEL